MAQQTFIVLHWYGAETYNEALVHRDKNGNKIEDCGHDFNRVSCKRKETALRYLKGWREQAKEQRLHWLYPTLVRDDARYAIVSTPDGYNEKDVVASGLMREL